MSWRIDKQANGKFAVYSTRIDDYVHRGGRTARGAALGIESTIATWQDIPMVRQIEAILGEKIPRCTVAGIEPWTESEKTPARRRMRV